MADILKAAFVGFRHMHMFDIYAHMERRRDVEIVAICEEDPQIRNRLDAEGWIAPTHGSFPDMLSTVQFDLLVVGDIFAKRGRRIIAGLEAGKHVLSDKPICTDGEELTEIEAAAGRQSLVAAAVLDLRDSGAFLRTRELVQAGTIGAVHTVSFSGQHPLLLDSRPKWYFQGNNHGGTINDLAIHAVDIIRWITGLGIDEVLAARCWNAGLQAYPQFRNAAQLMMVMDGGCGVIGDVSYIAPDGFRYTLPQYWRFNFWGDRGMIEMGLNEPTIRLYRAESEQVEEMEPAADRPGGYLEDLVQSIRGKQSHPNSELFTATRLCLKAQADADRRASRLAPSN
ncbi:MAG: Gfo/Idh/MocA family oxidoreductase [Spirochaetaceae bacterium]|nr:MAG: Gfo/Idh/MocA family oxidoreductase [Spirochaetaceae bacterium]